MDAPQASSGIPIIYVKPQSRNSLARFLVWENCVSPQAQKEEV
jgi:hypothetical protein